MANNRRRWIAGLASGALVLAAGWADAQATQEKDAAVVQPPIVNGGYQPTHYPESYYGGALYPGTELRALPGARAAAVAARTQYRNAQSALNTSVEALRRQFKRSAELKEAVVEEQAAWDALNSVRAEAMADLRDDSTYQAAVALRQRLADQIEYSRRDKDQSLEHLLALATMKLSYSATASAMEAAAISADPRVRQARERLVQASARVSELRDQFDEAVRTSPEVIAARQAVADARVAALAADAAYQDASRVARVAMDYAYYLYDHPYPYVINSPYYPYYGGGGYAYTYRIGYPIGYPHYRPQPHRPHPR